MTASVSVSISPEDSSRSLYHSASIRSTRRSSETNSMPIIIVAACAAVGGIIILLALWRLFRYLRRRRQAKLAPLPPPQPLAYQREQFISPANRNTRTSSFFEPTPFHALGTPSSMRSTSPLLSPISGDPRRDGSLPSSSDLASLSDAELIVPRAPFQHDIRASGSDVSVSTSGSPSPVMFPSTPQAADVDFPAFPAPSSVGSRLSSYPSSSSHARTHSSGYSALPRPQSLVSNLTTRSRANTIRGAPHGRHSRVEIVLPIPLAEQESRNPYETGSIDREFRKTFADQWTLASRPSLNKSSTPASGSRDRRRTTDTESLPPSPQRSAAPVRCASTMCSSSVPSAFSLSSDTAPTSASSRKPPPPPPVPRIPSMYSPATLQAHSRSVSASSELQTNPRPHPSDDRPDGNRGRARKRTISSGPEPGVLVKSKPYQLQRRSLSRSSALRRAAINSSTVS